MTSRLQNQDKAKKKVKGVKEKHLTNKDIKTKDDKPKTRKYTKITIIHQTTIKFLLSVVGGFRFGLQSKLENKLESSGSSFLEQINLEASLKSAGFL